MIMRVIFPKSAEDHCDSLLITYFRTIIDNIVDKDTGTAPRGGQGGIAPQNLTSRPKMTPQKNKSFIWSYRMSDFVMSNRYFFLSFLYKSFRNRLRIVHFSVINSWNSRPPRPLSYYVKPLRSFGSGAMLPQSSVQAPQSPPAANFCAVLVNTHVVISIDASFSELESF